MRFNTSYVSVQELSVKGVLMVTLFQYIICVGSRVDSAIAEEFAKCFNTSYVSVQV